MGNDVDKFVEGQDVIGGRGADNRLDSILERLRRREEVQLRDESCAANQRLLCTVVKKW